MVQILLPFICHSKNKGFTWQKQSFSHNDGDLAGYVLDAILCFIVLEAFFVVYLFCPLSGLNSVSLHVHITFKSIP